MQKLLAAIRAACPAPTWSRGVELSRAGAVTSEREQPPVFELRVTSGPGKPSALVTLYLDEAEWSCECPSREEACVHVAAAAIALSRARSEGKPLPRRGETAAHLVYEFKRSPAGLVLERFVAAGAQVSPLAISLTTHAQRLGASTPFAPSQTDYQIEAALGSRGRGALPREVLARVLHLLADADGATVQLDGKPLKVDRPLPLLRAVVEDCAEGVRVRVEQVPEVEELFANGAVLMQGALRPVGELGLSGRDLEELKRGRIVRPPAYADLVGREIPALERALLVSVRTQRLPTAVRQVPYIRIDSERRGPADLDFVATIVYGKPPTARLDGDRLVSLGGALPLRDGRAEQALDARLRNELGLPAGERRTLATAEAIRLATRLTSAGVQVHGDAQAFFALNGHLTPRLRLTAEGGFDLAFTLVAEGDGTIGDGVGRRAGASISGAPQIGANAVVQAWRQGASLLEMPGGGFAPLPADWLEHHGAVLADLLAARDDAGRLSRSATPDLAKLCAALGEPPPPELRTFAALGEGFTSVPQASLPADLAADLRPYQRHGVDWLVFLRQAGLGALLADDMGLGKTLQALCAVETPALVVAPTSVLHNWEKEIARFRPTLSCSTYHGPKRRLTGDADIVLTSYAVLRLDVETLAKTRFRTVVLDEAQAIKNPESQVAQAAFRLQGDSRIALTGTPIENRLDELWSQMHFLNRGLLGGRGDFMERYVRPIAGGDSDALARLRERVRPFLLRRLKREVEPELPPRTDVTLWVELDTEEQALYDALRLSTRADILERLGAGSSVMQILEALLRLRQAACHRALVPGGEAASSSSKIEVLLETLDEVISEGHKALVFSQWTGLLDLLEPHLKRSGIDFVRLDGSTRDRAGVVDTFQAPSGPPLMLISLKAGGTGLNLTAADHVFLLDPWWNPAVEDQAADRAHRIGQTRPVLVHRLAARDTVEERILGLQERKRALADAALGGASAEISREDLLALLD